MVYVLVHSINEACNLASFYEVMEAFRTKESAMRRIEEIKEYIATGNSHFFPNESPTPEQYMVSGTDGLTYQWYDEGGQKMFSHFYVKKIKETK